ncbi:MAG: NUDIX domain-containing protein [Candidatus Roizmanbacteria bacterium]
MKSNPHPYKFTETVKFFQKAIVLYPHDPKRFLILKRSSTDTMRPNTWDLPGGNVHFGEKHDISLLREVKEETYLDVKILKPLQVVTNYIEKEEDEQYIIFIGFLATTNTTEVVLSHEHTEYKWSTKDEFLEMESSEFLQNLVKEYVSS